MSGSAVSYGGRREAILREAVKLHVEDRLACGEDIPQVETISLITVEAAE